MYNVLISLAAALITYLVFTALLGSVAALLPAIAVGGITFFLIGRWVSQQMEGDLRALMPQLQAGKVDEAKGTIENIKSKWGPWQPLVAGQLDAQLGMLEFARGNLEEAKARLATSGRFRTWQSSLILGLIHHKQGRKEEAEKVFTDARWMAAKDPMLYAVPAYVLQRDGKREEALSCLADGLKSMPDNQILTEMKNKIANKKAIDTSRFGQAWFLFFPEELRKQQILAMKRGQMPPGAPQPEASNRKMRRQKR